MTHSKVSSWFRALQVAITTVVLTAMDLGPEERAKLNGGVEKVIQKGAFDIDELKQSIRDVGLSNPIRVEQVGDRYELIQGYRRLTAWRELRDEFAAKAS